MLILDSNILIYAAQPQFKFLLPLVMDSANAVSIVTTIETLGFQKLTPHDRLWLESAFKILQVLDLTLEISHKAIKIKQLRKFTLGDAIIAATAIVHDAELKTRNVDDFRHVIGLHFSNPIP